MASSGVLCLTIPAFPAWVFHRSGLVDRPLVVIAARRVVAASAHAERAGATSGMPYERVRAVLPDILVRHRDLNLERAVWEEVLLEFTRITPFAESAEPGVAFARIAGLDLAAGPAGDLATFRTLVHRLGAQAGAASARSLARLAALRAARGHTLVIEPEHLGTFLKQFPLTLLSQLGFSAEFTQRLNLFGYHTLFGAATLSRRHLKAQFGEEGARLYDLLHPGEGRSREEGPVPLFQPPPSITSRFDFDLPAREPGEILPVIEHLAGDTAGWLGAQLCRRVCLRLDHHGDAGPAMACRILPEATADARRILQTAKTLLVGLLAPDCEIDAVALELGTLETARFRQASLFGERPTVYDVARFTARRFPGALLRATLHPHVLFEEEAFSFEPFPTEPPVLSRSQNRSRRHR